MFQDRQRLHTRTAEGGERKDLREISNAKLLQDPELIGWRRRGVGWGGGCVGRTRPHGYFLHPAQPGPAQDWQRTCGSVELGQGKGECF